MQVGFNQLNNVNFRGTIIGKNGAKVDTKDVKRITGNETSSVIYTKGGGSVLVYASKDDTIDAFKKAKGSKDTIIDLSNNKINLSA